MNNTTEPQIKPANPFERWLRLFLPEKKYSKATIDELFETLKSDPDLRKETQDRYDELIKEAEESREARLAEIKTHTNEQLLLAGMQSLLAAAYPKNLPTLDLIAEMGKRITGKEEIL